MAKTRVAILGAKGFIGSFVSRELKKSHLFEIEELDREEIDIANKRKVNNWFKKTKSTFVINCVAYTNVDKAQQERDLAETLNVTGTKNLAIAACKYKKFLIHLSTDFIFPGVDEYAGPYSEVDFTPQRLLTNLGWYALTKLKAELAVKDYHCRWAIVRCSLPFGNASSDKDLVKKTINMLEKGYPLFNDQFITQTYLPDLVKALEKIIQNHIVGIFHVACHPQISPYEFGVYINKLIGNKYSVGKGSILSYLKEAQVSPRPILGGLRTTATQSTLGVKFHSIKSALKEYVKTIQASQAGAF